MDKESKEPSPKASGINDVSTPPTDDSIEGEGQVTVTTLNILRDSSEENPDALKPLMPNTNGLTVDDGTKSKTSTNHSRQKVDSASPLGVTGDETLYEEPHEDHMRRRSVQPSITVLSPPTPVTSSSANNQASAPEKLSAYLRRQGTGYNDKTKTVKIPITSASGDVIGLEEVPAIDTTVSPSAALITPRYDYNVIKGENAIIDDEGTFQGSYFRKIYITMFIVLLSGLAYIVGAIIMLSTPQTTRYPYRCTTDNCKRTGAWIKNAMDDKVHPCNNFYQFACGSYVKKHHAEPEAEATAGVHSHLYRDGIPLNFEENPSVGHFLKKINKFPHNQLLPFYQACIDIRKRNELGINPFVNLLMQVRLLFVQSTAYFSVISRFNVARMMGHIFRRTNYLFFFDFDDTKDDKILFKIAKPSREVILASPKIYAEAMRRCWKLMSKDLNIDDEEEIDTIVYLVMKFEAEVTLLQSKETESYVFGFPVAFDKVIPPPKKFHSNFINMRGRFNWEDLVESIMDYPTGKYEEQPLSFNWWHSFHSKQDRYYATLLVDKLENTPSYVIFRYFQWKLMKIFAFDLTEEVQHIMFDLFGSSGPTLVERCFRSVFSNLHVLAAHQYRTVVPDASALHGNMTVMINQVVNTFKTRMTGRNNLPSALKSAIFGTVNTLKILAMYGNNETEANMRKYYEGFVSGSNHFANVMKARTIKARNVILYARHKPPFDKRWHLEYSLTEWSETSIADAFSTTRYMHVPLGGIQEPFFGNDLPILNYAGFGHYLVALPLAKRAVEDLLTMYDSNLRVFEPRLETSLIKDFQRVFVERVECLMQTHLKLKSKNFPELTVNPAVRETKMRILAHSLSVELILGVIEEMINATNATSFWPYRSHFDELKHGNELIGVRFPHYQILPKLEKFTPMQLVFLSMARHHCESFTRTSAEMRMSRGPVLDEILLHGSFRNTESFSKVWNCPKGSFMNPHIKCPQIPALKEDEYYYDEDTNVVKTATEEEEETYEEEDLEVTA